MLLLEAESLGISGNLVLEFLSEKRGVTEEEYWFEKWVCCKICQGTSESQQGVGEIIDSHMV